MNIPRVRYSSLYRMKKSVDYNKEIDEKRMEFDNKFT